MASKSRQDSRGRPERKKRGLLFGLLIGAGLGLVVAGLMIWYFLPREGDFRTVASAPEVRVPPTAIATPAATSPAVASPSPPSGSSAAPPPTATASASAPGSASTSVTPSASTPAPANPEYTFYEILPGNQTPKPQATKPKPSPQAGLRLIWWLQVAALKSEVDANALRARLLLIELPAVVQKTGSDAAAMFRIRVGPFSDEATAQTAREKLRVNNFDAKLLKEAVTP